MGLPLNQLAYAMVTIDGSQAAGGGTSRPCVNVFCYKRANLALPLTEVALANTFIAGPLAALALAANVRWTPTQILVRFFDDPSRSALSTATAVVGAIATDAQPQQNTVSMKLQTGNRKPRCIGAKRFGGVNEIDTTIDVLTGAGLARWQAVQAAILGNIGPDANGNLWTPYVLAVSQSNLQQLPAAVVVAFPVTAVTLRKNVLTLKRRRSAQVI